jgi:WD40 repeat protein
MSDGLVLGRSSAAATTFALSANGQVVGLVYDNSIARWEPATQGFREIPCGAQEVAVSADGLALAAAGTDQRIMLVPHPEAPPEYLVGHGAPVLSITFSDDARTLFSASEDGAIRAWQLATRRELMSWENGSPANWLAVAPGDAGLLIGSQAPPNQPTGTYWFWPAASATPPALPPARPIPSWLALPAVPESN